jgi:hypothetical protein
MSLRLRPKPPEGLPTINAGRPWPEDDLADLQDLVREAYSPREIAEHLRREVLEVEAIRRTLPMRPVARQ